MEQRIPRKASLQNKFDLPFDINIEYTGDLKDAAQLGIGYAGVMGGVAVLLVGGGGTVASGGSASGLTVPVAWEGVAMIGAGAIAVKSALGNMFKVSISKTDSGNINSSGGDSDSKKNKIPDNDSTTGHIFRDAEGHIPDTPENRALLEDVANDPTNFRGTDKYGNEWYTKIQNDGSQVWVESRNGNIFEGGVNNTPKQWNPETGLKKP